MLFRSIAGLIAQVCIYAGAYGGVGLSAGGQATLCRHQHNSSSSIRSSVRILGSRGGSNGGVCYQNLSVDFAFFGAGLLCLFASGTFFGSMTFTAPPPPPAEDGGGAREEGEDTCNDTDSVAVLVDNDAVVGDSVTYESYSNMRPLLEGNATPSTLHHGQAPTSLPSSPPAASRRHEDSIAACNVHGFLGFREPCNYSRMTFVEHLHHTLRAVLSLLGQTLVWTGSATALALTAPLQQSADVAWRPLFLFISGAFMMEATDSFVANSFVEDEADDDDVNEGSDDEGGIVGGSFGDGKSSTDVGGKGAGGFFWVNAFLSLFGQLMFNFGVWTLVDTFIVGTAMIPASMPGIWFLPYRYTELNLVV